MAAALIGFGDPVSFGGTVTAPLGLSDVLLFVGVVIVAGWAMVTIARRLAGR